MPVTDIDLLAHGDLEVLGRLQGSSNATLLVRLHPRGELPGPREPGSPIEWDLEADAAASRLGIYKPRDGEQPLWDFAEGSLCGREVAAFELANWLGWPAIPRTILRDGPYGVGAVQRFVSHDGGHHAFSLIAAHEEDYRKIAAFDVVVNNADRKGGHTLLAQDGTITCIDHGVCFAVEPKLRSVIWDFADEVLAPTLRDDLGKLTAALGAGGDLRARLEPLLTTEEIDATSARLDALLASGRYPEPSSERSWPWPPI